MPYGSEPPSGDDSTRAPRVGPLTWLFGFPQAVYDQGTQHGREWHRTCTADDSSGNKSHHHFRRCCRQDQCERGRPTESVSRTAALAADSTADGPQDWSNWVRSELDRGEKVAKAMYDSWDKEYGRGNPTGSPDPDRKGAARSPQPVLAGQLWKPLEEVEHDLRSVLANLGNEMEGMEQLSDRYGPEFWEFYMLNPYSPLRLEHEAGFDSSWRTRFEDLIRAERQQELLNKDEAAVTQRQSAFDWFHGLQSRVNPATGTPTTNADAEQQTELDAYRHFVPQARSNGLLDAIEKSKQQRRKDGAGPEVKSVFRTVNRHSESDGSTTTKTVVRKTFADGKTEKTETVETSPPRRVEPPALKLGTANPTDNAPKRGWFWSS
jgi:hypothetical protein